MRRTLLTLALAAGILAASTGPAAAETARLGTASASSIGGWVKPEGCSWFPVAYDGLLPDQRAQIYVRDAATRAVFTAAPISFLAPRSGQINILLCEHQVRYTERVLLSLEVYDPHRASPLGSADSAAFELAPGTVRCMNNRTDKLRQFQGRPCPAGWTHVHF